MPLPALLLPLLGLAATAASTASSANQNKKNIQFQRETNRAEQDWSYRMYLQQRFDNLMDWNRQNRYNSPEQQMQRLKEAGLNPHLVYGNGATATAGAVNSSSASNPRLSAPRSEFDPSQIPNALYSFQDATIKTQQLDNLRRQSDLLAAQTDNTNMKTANEYTEGQRSKFELGKAQDLKDLIIEEQRLRNEKTRSETSNIEIQQQFEASKITMRSLEIELKRKQVELQSAKTAADIDKIHEDILRSIVYRETNPVVREKMSAEIQNIILSGKLRAVEIELKSLGLQPGSPEYINRWTKMVGAILQGAGTIGQMVR